MLVVCACIVMCIVACFIGFWGRVFWWKCIPTWLVFAKCFSVTLTYWTIYIFAVYICCTLPVCSVECSSNTVQVLALASLTQVARIVSPISSTMFLETTSKLSTPFLRMLTMNTDVNHHLEELPELIMNRDTHCPSAS